MENQQQLTEEQRKAVLEMQVVTKVSLIAQICKILEGCGQRGAFKAEEMTYIGGIYDSLSKVVKDSVQKVKESEETAVVEETTVEGEEEQ